MINLDIKNRILFGIYIIYCIRKLKNPFITESFALAALAIFLTYFVSVPSVLSNMRDSESFLGYLFVAFSNTNFAVQTTLILAVATFLFFVRNLTFHAILKTRPA